MYLYLINNSIKYLNKYFIDKSKHFFYHLNLILKFPSKSKTSALPVLSNTWHAFNI